MYHLSVRHANLCTDCRTIAITHGTQAAGGQEGTRLAPSGELCCPHLMLSNICCYNVILAQQLIDLAHQLVRTKDSIIILRLVIHTSLPVLDLFLPRRMVCTMNQRHQRFQYVICITDNAVRNADILIDLRRVDIHLDNLCAGCKITHLGCHTVRETGTQCNNQIRLVYCPAGGNPAMHTNQAQIQRVCRIQCANAHQGMACRHIGTMHKLAEQLTGIGGQHAAAKQDDRTLTLINHLCHLFDLVMLDLRLRTRLDCRLVLKFTDRRGDILGNINQNRARTVTHGNFICLTDGICQLLYMTDHKVMLGDRHGHTCNIDFLEAVTSDKGRTDIGSNGNHRDGIHKCRCDTGNQIGGTRAGCCKTYANLAGCACITVCRMGRTLLMCSQDMADTVGILIKLIINIEGCTARITENGIGSLFQQCLKQNL